MNIFRSFLFIFIIVASSCSDDTATNNISNNSNNTNNSNNLNNSNNTNTNNINNTSNSNNTNTNNINNTNNTNNINGDLRLTSGITVDRVILWQAVEIPIYEDSSEVIDLNAPIIASRQALFSVYVTTASDFTSRSVQAVLFITNSSGTTTYTSTATLGASANQDIDSPAFTFVVDAPHMTTDMTFSMAFTDETSPAIAQGTAHEGLFPSDAGSFTLDVESDLGGLNLVLVPVEYNIDGSGRMPDTSPTQLAIIEELLHMLYPISNLNLTVRAPIEWPQPGESASSFDFGDMNVFLRDLKADDGAPSEAYYYALVRPDETFEDYCSGTCTTGQSYVVSDPDSGSYRVGTGVGFSGERWVWTLLHEVGHMHGRKHARCGTLSGLDWNYPYSGGGIGTWGYDWRSSFYVDPDIYTDFMSYCDDNWISDYNYRGLFNRVTAVNSLKKSSAPTHLSRLLIVKPDGTFRLTKRPTAAPRGKTLKVIFLDSAGTILSVQNLAAIRQSHSDDITIAADTIPPGTVRILLQ
ncbi:hypothetical protein KKF34_17490 [Myxococcota bacterium]|nr:hypothetical protein [Myxococcota bacterium]MBU1382461.1 hypothetical protein [Myxococcota bacterium]MBU1498676.1 hypothetical protein [Myxococcota bacterium]